MSAICFLIVTTGMLIFTLYSNMKLYKLVYHHQLDQMIMESSQEYDDLLSLFDEKTQRKIKTDFCMDRNGLLVEAVLINDVINVG